MEKVINEFRVIETDDGFRIEIKGDKEKIKSFMSGFGMPGVGGHAHRHHRGGHRRAGRFGPFGHHFGPWMWMKAGSCCGDWSPDEDTEEASEA